MAAFDGSPSPIQLILVVENKTSKEKDEDVTPVNVTLQGKLASRWKKLRQNEGVNDVELAQLLLDRYEDPSHVTSSIPAVTEKNTSSKGSNSITQPEALPEASGSKDGDDETYTVFLPTEEESTEGNQKNKDEPSEPEDVDETIQEDESEELGNMEEEEEEEEEDDGGKDDKDWDSDPAGMKGGSDSDEYKPDSDSDWDAESDEISDEDWEGEDDDLGGKKKRNKSNPWKDEGLPFQRFDMKEVAKNEGVEGDVTGNRQRTRITRLYWTEMMRSYHCKVCSYQSSSARQVCLHLLQEHHDMVGDLVNFLQSKPASDSDPGITMYTLVIEMDPLTGSFCGEPNFAGFVTGSTEPIPVGTVAGDNELDLVGTEADGSEPNPVGMDAGDNESNPFDIKARNGAPEEDQDSGEKGDENTESATNKESKSGESGIKDKTEGSKTDFFDEREFITLLVRWVDLTVTCQYCQKEACRGGVFTRKGKEVVHLCRTNEPDNVLCDICGKTFSYTIFRSHWKDVHGQADKTLCPYCGKMYRTASLNQHINNLHNSKTKNKYPCGICGKGFKNTSARRTHEAIHKKDKPHMCSYCGRRFTQLSNMRYHMRQHTGEKPYRCDTCHVSFTHNVSLKNHLKKQHGIDLWEMGYTGGGRPKKQKVQVEAAE